MAQVRTAVFLADGFEEVEAVTPIDYLRRADIEVIIAGVGSSAPTGSKGVRINADVEIDELSGELDAVILPGGMPGATNLASSAPVERLCAEMLKSGKLVAAICAAPAVALNRFGLLEQRKFTCYPGYEKQVMAGRFLPERVIVDGNLITSRGPGTAGEFAVEIIRYLTNDQITRNIAKATLLEG
ncbi:MAG: DJ-1 family protein [spirochete symbiont of Stewartia floridana]|nr:MAG: DJ-1 family protein [spirochete symbiont of Stewartia floridana]